MIEVSNLRKHYGPIRAVDNISFSVNQGEIVGFLGPNGAGKSTTMKMLTCFLAPTSGEARVAGSDVQTESMAVRRTIGYLPEDTPLYSAMTVLEFLTFVAAAREVPKSRLKERLRVVVDICGIGDRMGQTIGTLSKGFRQRVGLAQALVHDPDVLILDEPTSGLDPNQIAEIREVIKRLGQEKTLILSTHVLSEVEATCNRVIIIDQGSVVGDGSIDVLSRAREAQAGFVLTVESDQTPSALRERFAGLKQVDTVQEVPSPLGPSFVITPKPDTDPRLELMRVCVDEGWIVLTLTPKAANLEDIFRSLTQGQSFGVGGAAGAAAVAGAAVAKSRAASADEPEPKKKADEKKADEKKADEKKADEKKKAAAANAEADAGDDAGDDADGEEEAEGAEERGDAADAAEEEK